MGIKNCKKLWFNIVVTIKVIYFDDDKMIEGQLRTNKWMIISILMNTYIIWIINSGYIDKSSQNIWKIC